MFHLNLGGETSALRDEFGNWLLKHLGSFHNSHSNRKIDGHRENTSDRTSLRPLQQGMSAYSEQSVSADKIIIIKVNLGTDMSETIYVLTVIYFAYVIEETEGECIVAFIKDVLHVDLSKLHNVYIGLRNKIGNLIRFKTMRVA
jgi:hypothetical protein